MPYVVLTSKTGFTWETALTLIFSGIIGGITKARKDLEKNPNLYTPAGVAGITPLQAIAYVAQNIVLEQATQQVIPRGASERIEEVAENIIATTPIPELLKPYTKKVSRNFFGKGFR